MSAVSDLYQSIILEHSKQPRHYGALQQPTHTAEGYNPLCGDHVEIFLQLQGQRIESLSFKAAACAITTASASMMASELQGQSLQDAQQCFEDLQARIAEEASDGAAATGTDPLAALAEVRKFPGRIACATLPWQTLMKAFDSEISN